MYRIGMDIQCLDGFSEILPQDVENTECVVEDIVSLVLLDMFGMVIVDGVTIAYVPATGTKPSHCSIQVDAACPLSAFAKGSRSIETIELAVEDAISCVLIQLFGAVVVNQVSLHFISWEDEEVSADRLIA